MIMDLMPLMVEETTVKALRNRISQEGIVILDYFHSSKELEPSFGGTYGDTKELQQV